MINTQEIFKKHFNASVEKKKGLTFTEKEWKMIMPEFQHVFDAMIEASGMAIDMAADLAKNKAQKSAILNIKKQIE
jgi:hypothetical protein